MKVITAPDGSFAFIFHKDEKQLGIAILESFNALNEDGEKEIADAISRIITAGDNKTMQ